MSDWIKVDNSSNIKGFSFELDKDRPDEEFGRLTVQFSSGMVYDYDSVPAETFEELVSAFAAGDSVGKEFNRLIRGQYEGQRRIPCEEER